MKIIKNLKAEEIRKSILQLAIQGKLVKQDPSDEPASELVKKIYAEKQKLIKEGKIKKDKNESFIFKGDDNCYYEKIGNNKPVKLEDLPFDIPNSWTWIKIKNLFEIRNGFTPLRSNQNYWKNGTINWFTVEDIHKQGRRIFDTVIKINECACTKERIVPPDSLLLCCTASIGEFALTNISLTTNQQFNSLSLIETKTKAYDMNFLLAIAPWFKSILINLAGTTTFPFVSTKKLKNVTIPLPPLNEQKRIIDKINFLEPLLEKYENLEKKLTNLENDFPEKLKKSILQYAIEGKLVKQDPNDEPASVLLERIKREKEKLIKEGKIKRDNNESYIYKGDDKNYYAKIGNKVNKLSKIPFEIPENWFWIKFSDLVYFSLGKTPERHNSKYWSNGAYNWISISDMKEKEIVYSSKEKISSIALKELFNNNLSPKGTLLMSFKLTIGKVSFLGEDSVHNEAIISIFPYLNDYNIIRDYLLYTLKIFTSFVEITDAIKGSTLNKQKLNSMLIALPTLNEQKRILDRIRNLYNQIDD